LDSPQSRSNCSSNCHKEILGLVEEKFKELREYLDRKLKEVVGRPIEEEEEVKTNNEDHKQKFVIHGIEETVGEKIEEVERKVRDLLRTTMKIPERTAVDMISGVSRMGKEGKKQNYYRPDPGRNSRPVLLQLLREKHRSIFIGNLHHLKNSGLKVESYLSVDKRKDKNKLLEKRKEAKAEGHSVKMIADDKLMVIVDKDKPTMKELYYRVIENRVEEVNEVQEVQNQPEKAKEVPHKAPGVEKRVQNQPQKEIRRQGSSEKKENSKGLTKESQQFLDHMAKLVQETIASAVSPKK